MLDSYTVVARVNSRRLLNNYYIFFAIEVFDQLRASREISFLTCQYGTTRTLPLARLCFQCDYG